MLKRRMKALHREMCEVLGEELDVRMLVDTARIVERAVAARAGLGWYGKSANLFVPGHGTWVLLGEIFPTRLRGKAMGVATGMHWIANFIVSTSFPVVSEISLGLAYGIFTAFAVISLLFVKLFLPETNGLSLEQADTLLPTTRSSERYRRRS